jgi:tRNA (cytidine/uridine-2'-O-)-methyltransferase
VINVVLYCPENPFNTGAIVRTCSLMNAMLHLIKPWGFANLDGDVRRASMSYLDTVDVRSHESYVDFVSSLPTTARLFAMWDEGSVDYRTVTFSDNDYVLFGRESDGLPAEVLANVPTLRVPMPGVVKGPRVDTRDHSLNLSVTVGIVTAWALYGPIDRRLG